MAGELDAQSKTRASYDHMLLRMNNALPSTPGGFGRLLIPAGLVLNLLVSAFGLGGLYTRFTTMERWIEKHDAESKVAHDSALDKIVALERALLRERVVELEKQLERREVLKKK